MLYEVITTSYLSVTVPLPPLEVKPANQVLKAPLISSVQLTETSVGQFIIKDVAGLDVTVA